MNSIRLVLSVSFRELTPIGVSFFLPLASLPFLRLLKSYIVSSYCYHYLLISIATFISLLVVVSIGSNRYKDGGNIDGNLAIFKGVKGFGNTQ